MIGYLIQGLILGATAAVQPGPLQAYLLSLTTRFGWRRALPVTFSPLISDGPIVLLVILVLTAAPPIFLYGLQVVGGLFLLYLAFGAYRSFRNAAASIPEPENVPQYGLLKGAFLNLLSPNPYIFWATIAGPIFINGWREAPQNGIGFVIGFYIALIGGFMAFVALVSIVGGVDVRLNKGLLGLSSLALLIFGLYQFGKGLIQILSL